MNKKFLSVLLAGMAGIFQTQAQLAITEVMSSEANSAYPDWWELKNFGTNAVDLTGYAWNDDSHGGLSGGDTLPFTGVIVQPGETIICTEQKGSVITAADFRTWWGISGGVQVVVLNAADPGLGSGGDAVRLWSTNGLINGVSVDAGDEFLVDRVDIGSAFAGQSLTYNTNSGLFDVSSTNGINSAFQAATQTDVGSPGVGPTNAPVVISQQPSNVLVNIGITATFTVTAYGLPKPRFQWLLDGSPVDTNRVTTTFTVLGNYSIGTLIVTNCQATNAGTYRVIASNGFNSVLSSNAQLTVSGDPLPPYFTQMPSSLSAYLGQIVTFKVSTFANPPSAYQWQFNGTNLDGQTDPQLQFSVTDTNQTGTYSVIVTNSVGGTNASATLLVTPKPNLRITEIMSSEGTNAAGSTLGHGDWWELSNLGTFPVNIHGYRFDDNSYSLAQAYTITNDVTIAPGESIVLCEDMTPDEFRTWWGAGQLPANLQIVSYHFSAISFSSAADALTVWNPAATTESDYLDSVGISTATTGVSFGFDPYTRTFTGYGPDGLSVAGVNGGITAAVNGDIGSPGAIVNLPGRIAITPTSGGIQLSWANQPNWNYTVQYKTNLTDLTWTTLANATSDGSSVFSTVDSTPATQRFYRISLSPVLAP